MSLTHLSLFSGIGGLDLAAEWAGFRTVGQVEMADYPFQVLRRRFGRLPRWRDVRDVTGEAVIKRCGVPTIISGGFPCQPHSLAGKRLASCDERDLWGELARIVREVRPRWFVGENVAGLRSSESGRFFGRVLRDLAEMGYTVGWGSWEAADAGAPHHRERVFVVAHAAGVRCAECPERERGGATEERGVSQPLTGSAGVAHTHEGRCEWSPVLLRQRRSLKAEIDLSGARSGFPDTKCLRRTQHGQDRRVGGLKEPAPGDGGEQWSSEPIVGRVADGVPCRVDRLRALGNAVVPQQAYPIFAAIAAIETGAIA